MTIGIESFVIRRFVGEARTGQTDGLKCLNDVRGSVPDWNRSRGLSANDLAEAAYKKGTWI